MAAQDLATLPKFAWLDNTVQFRFSKVVKITVKRMIENVKKVSQILRNYNN